MAKKPKTYQKLARPSASVGSYHTLWLAADHLMAVSSTGVSEDYQRFYFRDIKAFITAPTKRYTYWNLALVPMLLLALIPSILALSSGLTPTWQLGWLVLPSVLLVWNLFKGGSCQVEVVTELQRSRLQALTRRKVANRVLARLVTEIEAAQADLVEPMPEVPPVDSSPTPGLS